MEIIELYETIAENIKLITVLIPNKMIILYLMELNLNPLIRFKRVTIFLNNSAILLIADTPLAILRPI